MLTDRNCLLLDKECVEDVLQIQEYYDDIVWIDKWHDYLESEKIDIVSIPDHLYDNSLYLVSGKTIRNTRHICIYKNGKLFHDPHPDDTGLITEDVFQIVKYL